MSSSSRTVGENEGARVDLPVFVSPIELVFSPNKRRCFLTIYNPYGNEAQYRVMTTSPDRFDVSATKGLIKPSRRVDITIRLLNSQIEELPEPVEELQAIDYFRIWIQVGQLKGNRPVKVNWCLNAEAHEPSDSRVPVLGADEKAKFKIKSSRSSANVSAVPLVSNPSTQSQRNFSNIRTSSLRSGRQAIDQLQSSNVNLGAISLILVCTLCAIACVITLFLPLAIDNDLCKKGKAISEITGLISQLTTFLSVSYEVKLGCSFALGLFTYRLISTLPD